MQINQVRTILKKRINSLSKTIEKKELIYNKYFDPNFYSFKSIFTKVPVSTFDVIPPSNDGKLINFALTLLKCNKLSVKQTSFDKFISIPIAEREDYIKNAKIASRFYPESSKKELRQFEQMYAVACLPTATVTFDTKANIATIENSEKSEYDKIFAESGYTTYYTSNNKFEHYHLHYFKHNSNPKITIKLTTTCFTSNIRFEYSKIIIKDGVYQDNTLNSNLLTPHLKEILSISTVDNLPEEVKNYLILS